MTKLSDLSACFEGVMPSAVASCAPDGTPNVTWLSIVHRVDDDHVALSFQFFNKTRANVQGNPHAQVLVSDPTTARQWRLDVVYERTDLDGPMFDRVKTQLDAIASQTGMTDVFRLRGLDVYRVRGIEEVAGDSDHLEAPIAQADLGRIESFSARISQMTELDGLVETALSLLATLFEYAHSFLLATAEDEASLFTLGSHGFQTSGIGSDVRVGEGLIGVAARSRLPVRVTNMQRQLIYARAVRVRERDAVAASQREIPLPGLPDVQSQLAMPLVAGGRLVGVLCLQSETVGRFKAIDEQVIAIASRQLASAMLALGSDASIDSEQADEPEASAEKPAVIRYYAADDSVFIDDDYLIKGVAGRILWRLLHDFTTRGRADFSNKELRADRKLGLPGHRDNLEARLVLLRKRLEEQCTFLRLAPTGRGRFRLVVSRALALDAVDG